MENSEEVGPNANRGAEWEVVSLTASAYAAAPSADQVGPPVIDEKENMVVDENTSDALFMSGHFVFPPSQHENLPIESEATKKQNVQEGKDEEDEIVVEQVGKSDTIEGKSLNAKGLTMEDEFPGITLFDDQGNSLSKTDFDLATEETRFFSSHTTFTESTSDIPHPTDPSVRSLGLSPQQLPDEEEEEDKQHNGSELPCQAWWKRQALSLYTHAKDANSFWSIFVAAAVMGLVIIGQHWQKDKCQLGINDEKIGRMLGRPIYRLKDVIFGGNRRGSFIRGNPSADH
ncbi:ATG8-interacting protein 1-like [Impatiens glandulifera]|uniref:ATG8-interacting protein 1-like n=1 Tax=Impatiens glandulifera TaxID=253017 RepID=UPI001FB11F29|nr:ATG8-interacting protein 1-like [Impatiens glandulifera]